MARMIPNAERITRARDLIQQARDLPVPPGAGRYDLAYIAGVKDLLRQARDLVKFIQHSVSASAELKAEAKAVLAEADQASQEIFHGKPDT